MSSNAAAPEDSRSARDQTRQRAPARSCRARLQAPPSRSFRMESMATTPGPASKSRQNVFDASGRTQLYLVPRQTHPAARIRTCAMASSAGDVDSAAAILCVSGESLQNERRFQRPDCQAASGTNPPPRPWSNSSPVGGAAALRRRFSNLQGQSDGLGQASGAAAHRRHQLRPRWCSNRRIAAPRTIVVAGPGKGNQRALRFRHLLFLPLRHCRNGAAPRRRFRKKWLRFGIHLPSKRLRLFSKRDVFEGR